MPKRTLALLFLASALAQAQPITIQNPGFENATLSGNTGTGPYSNLIVGSTVLPATGTLPNWTAASTTLSAWAGAFSPTNIPKYWNGNNLGYINILGSGTVSLSQTLTATLQSNVKYTMSALVAPPAVANFALQLWAGSTLLVSGGNLQASQIGGTATTDSVTYDSGANNPQAGQPLKIVITSTGTVPGITSLSFDDVTLTASGSTAVTVGAVISAGGFGAFSAIAPGTWIEIYGSNLATNTRSWAGSDFVGTTSPTKLDGTSVAIGGQAAFVDYISPGQVNALVPSNVGIGTQQLTVTAPNGISSPFTVTVNSIEPGLLAPSSFSINGTQYVVALFTDGTYVLPAGAIAGINSRPAKPGDVIVLYGIGFGPVTPNIPAGQVVGQSNSVSSGLQISIGGQMASLPYDGLAFNYTGLYQFNVTVPQVSPGTLPLTFSLGGAPGTQALNIAIGQ